MTVLTALATAIFINRPSGNVSLRLLKSSEIQIDNKFVALKKLPQQLKSKLKWHRLWRNDPSLIFTAPSSTPIASVREIVEAAKASGFQKIVLTGSDGTVWGQPQS